MFVQIIEGKTRDADGLARQGARWREDLSSGAKGFLGVTAGVSPAGHAISIVRFESEAAARANSERPEQSAWWSETEKYYDGEVTFTESDDVTQWLAGGSDDAGFVQVMKSTGVDRARLERLDQDFEEMASHRPDLIGGQRVWTGPDSCIEVVYFTSEAAAREGEKAEPPAELQPLMAELQELMAGTEFIDLPDPQLY